MSFIPDDFKVPEAIDFPDFRIRKLMYDDADLDYKAVMSSIDIIHQTRGGTWPTEELTLKEDLIDLGWHQREFEFRSSFAFTVMSLDEKECLGCMYLYKPGFRSDATKGADVDVSFWVTQSAYDRGLYPKLYAAIDGWLKSDWPFKKIGYSNASLPTGDQPQLAPSLPYQPQ